VIRRFVQALAVMVAAVTFFAPAQAGAAETETTELGGYQGVAAASGIHVLYNPAGLLPLPPPVDIGAPDALTTIATGPATFARASVLDPGALLASPDVLLGLAVPGYPAGTVPAYPFRISAESGAGPPRVESNPGPGLNARVAAEPSESTAQASMPAADAPAVAVVASSSALTTTKADESTVTVRARTKTTGINVLGLIEIDSVVTDITATSTGGPTKLAGGTTVLGAKVLDQAVTIDEAGVHQKPGAKPLLPLGLAGLTGNLNSQLKQLGIQIAVAGPVKLAGGNTGELASTGLRIDLNFSTQSVPALVALLDSLPPIDNPIPGAPVGPEDLIAAAKAVHLTSIEIGRGFVSLSARQAAVFDDETPLESEELPSLALVPSFELPDAPIALTPGGPRTVLRGTPAAAFPPGTGVGALILLALIAVPFIGELIARACGAVLATDESEICTWEER